MPQSTLRSNTSVASLHQSRQTWTNAKVSLRSPSDPSSPIFRMTISKITCDPNSSRRSLRMVTEALEKHLDATHSNLLRTSFEIHYWKSVQHEPLRASRASPASFPHGHMIRVEGILPLQEVLLLSLQGPRRQRFRAFIQLRVGASCP